MNSEYQNVVAFTNDIYWGVEEAKIPLLDRRFLRFDANRDTISVWNRAFFPLEDHLDRFERNIWRLRFECPYSRDEQRAILTGYVRRTGFRNAYVQMLMTRRRPPIAGRDIRQCANKFHVFCLSCM